MHTSLSLLQGTVDLLILRALTQGRGSFTMTFDRYVEVPANVQESVLKQLQAVPAS